MDKILSEIERQRRAENIYYTRRNGTTSFENEIERSGSNIYKRLFQILLFINIVLVIFGIQNKGYVFKDEFIADVDILIDNIKQRAEITPEEMIIENNIDVENKINNAQNNGDNEIVENITMSDLKVEKETQKIEEEKEIEALIGMYQFKRPIENGYVITSRFGERNSENESGLPPPGGLHAPAAGYVRRFLRPGVPALYGGDQGHSRQGFGTPDRAASGGGKPPGGCP